MSYHSQYIVFNPEKAERLSSADLLHKELTDEELLREYISLGSNETYEVSDPHVIEDLAVAHSLKCNGYLEKEALLALFTVLDSTTIGNIVPKEALALDEARREMTLLLDYISKVANNTDSLDTKYSLDLVQRYAVPLFEEHGIVIYTKVNKSTLLELLATLDPQKVETAIRRASFADEASVLHQEGILQTLKGLKKIVTALQESPQSLLVFEDDYGVYPEHHTKELLSKIKSRL